MENNNIPINKIVSILVAIVVTACILVPLCNEFGNSGGNGSGNGYIYMMPWTNTELGNDQWYTFYPDDFDAPDDTIVYTDGNRLVTLSNNEFNTVYVYNDAFIDNKLLTKDTSVFSVKFDTYYYALLFAFTEDGGNRLDRHGSMGSDTKGWFYSPTPTEYVIVDAEHIINAEEEGKEIWEVLTYRGESEELVVPYYITTVDNAIPSGGNGGSDSGITGTLFQILPVFVLLAIIGSIAFMFVDRKATA